MNKCKALPFKFSRKNTRLRISYIDTAVKLEGLLTRQRVKQAIARTSHLLGDTARLQVNIALCSPAYIQQLNMAYRNKDKPTNILSFASDGDGAELGDLCICLDVLIAEATEQQKTYSDHLLHLIVHGVLHLYGLDHEGPADEAAHMEALEVQVLAQMGVGSPYSI
jgi:probable rRNA maturation factor